MSAMNECTGPFSNGKDCPKCSPARSLVGEAERAQPITDSTIQHLPMACGNRYCAQHRDIWRHYEDNIALAVSTPPVASAPVETLKMIAGWFHTGANREQGLSAEICRVQELQLLEIIGPAALSPAQVVDKTLEVCNCGKPAAEHYCYQSDIYEDKFTKKKEGT